MAISRVLLFLILLLAFALRLTVAQNNLTTRLASDERGYLRRAVQISENPLQDRVTFRPPLYAYALALVNTPGQARFLVSGFQALIDTVSVALLFVLTRALVGRTAAALLAALLYALSPMAIGLSSSVFSDTLFMCLTLAGFVLTVRAAQPIEWNASVLLPFLAGVCFALAALTRELIVYFALAVIPIWWLVFVALPRRTRLLQTGALLVGMSVLLGPWVVRNQMVAGRFLLISTSSEYNFARDNVRAAVAVGALDDTSETRKAFNREIRDELEAQPPNARAMYAYRRGWDAIAASGLYWLGYKARSLGTYWNPLKFDRAQLGLNALPAALVPVVSVLIAGYWVAVLLFAIVGFAAAPDPAAKLLLALFLLYSFLLLLLTHYQLRYRFPIQVMMLPYAGYGLWLVSEMVRRRTLYLGELSARRLALAAVPLTVSVFLIIQSAQR